MGDYVLTRWAVNTAGLTNLACAALAVAHGQLAAAMILAFLGAVLVVVNNWPES